MVDNKDVIDSIDKMIKRLDDELTESGRRTAAVVVGCLIASACLLGWLSVL